MPQLFVASSLFPKEKKEELTYRWYRPDRLEPPVRFDLFVSDYSSLSPDQQRIVQKRASELLTQEELNQLKEYLMKNKGLDVVAHEVRLPFETRSILGTVSSDVLELWKEPGYNLPFRIEGYVYTDVIKQPEKIDTGTQD